MSAFALKAVVDTLAKIRKISHGMRKYLAIVLLLTTACSTQGDHSSKSDQWKAIESIEGARSVSVKARNGDTTEYIFAQTTDFQSQITTKKSEMAKACEGYARRLPAEELWLQSCDKALVEPDLSLYNQSATRLNKAVILGNLGDSTNALKTLKLINENNPSFNEADYEIARLNYLSQNYSEAIQYAQSSITKGLINSSRAYYIIGKSYEYDFQFSAARNAYEMGLEKSGNSARLRKSLERLNRLWPEKQNQ